MMVYQGVLFGTKGREGMERTEIGQEEGGAVM